MEKISDVHNIFEPKMPIRVCNIPCFLGFRNKITPEIIQCKVLKRTRNNKLYIITFKDNTLLLVSLIYMYLENFHNSNYKRLKQIDNNNIVVVTDLHISYDSLFTFIGNLDLKDLHNYISIVNEKP